MNQEAQPELAVLSCFIDWSVFLKRLNLKSGISNLKFQISNLRFEISYSERRIAAGFPPVGGVFAGRLFVAIALFIIQGSIALV